MAEKTQWHSWKVGELSKGCKLCVKGRKTVLFATGLCSKKTMCYYCPIADTRSGKDVAYANETKIDSAIGLIEEIRICSSEGIGITGGDPLMKINKTIEFINSVKKEFGKGFHVHLYCPMELVSDERLKKLNDAGLDEIRFHLDIENKDMWHKLELAKFFRWKIGVEIPVIPGNEKKYAELIEFVKGKVDFLNMNELEMSDSEVCKISERGFEAKSEFSYAVNGSEDSALSLLKNCNGINVHYCTVKLKDDVQIVNRLRNRLKNIRRQFDEVEDYHLIRGAVYTRELKPGFGYRKVLENIQNKADVLNNLEIKKNELAKKLSIKKELFFVDKIKPRILTSQNIVKKFKDHIKSMGLIPAIVEELPSGDEFEIDIDFL